MLIKGHLDLRRRLVTTVESQVTTNETVGSLLKKREAGQKLKKHESNEDVMLITKALTLKSGKE